MFESFAGASEFDFINSLPYFVEHSLPPHYGAIVDADLEHWQRQPFVILLHELIKTRRTTQGLSSEVHTLFDIVFTTISIVEYDEVIDPWFHETRQQNHPSAESLLSATEAQAFVSFIRQCAHDSTLPTEHRGIYQKIFADILADTETDASTFNMIRWKPHLEHLHIAFAAKNLQMDSSAQDLRAI